MYNTQTWQQQTNLVVKISAATHSVGSIPAAQQPTFSWEQPSSPHLVESSTAAHTFCWQQTSSPGIRLAAAHQPTHSMGAAQQPTS